MKRFGILLAVTTLLALNPIVGLASCPGGGGDGDFCPGGGGDGDFCPGGGGDGDFCPGGGGDGD